MRGLAAAGRAIIIALCIQYIYLVFALCVIPAQELQHQAEIAKHNIVELHETAAGDDGHIPFTGHFVKRPLLPDCDYIYVFEPVYVLLFYIVFIISAWRFLRERLRRVHSPPILPQEKTLLSDSRVFLYRKDGTGVGEFQTIMEKLLWLPRGAS